MRPLSPREQDILDAAASGLTYGEMARRFYLAESTIKNTAAGMLRAMSACTIAHAVAKWMVVREDYQRAEDGSRAPVDLTAIVGDVPAPPPARAATLGEYIADHLIREDDCTVWTGPMRGGRPMAWFWCDGDHQTVSVRRYLYEARHGPLAAHIHVYAACPHQRARCVSHLVLAPSGTTHTPSLWRPYRASMSVP